MRAGNAGARRRSRLRARCRALAVVAAGWAACGPLAGTPAAAAEDVPAQLSVTVVPPAGAAAPRPTGRVAVSLDGTELFSVPLMDATKPITAATPLTSAALSLLGRNVTISYSGDSNYEASDGTTVTIPTRKGLTIVARPRDTAAPAIEILSPADGVRYARGEQVVVVYSCKDPDDRSAVIRCEGPVATGARLDTATAGTFTFQVRSADALGNSASKSVTFTVGAAAGVSEPPPAATHGSSGVAPPPPPPPPAVAVTPVVPTAPAAPAPPAETAVALVPTSTRAAQRPSARAASGAGAKPAPAPSPPAKAAAKPADHEYAPYDPRSEPEKTVGILVGAFTLLQLGTAGGGLALTGAAKSHDGEQQGASDGGGQGGSGDPSMVYEAVDVEYIAGAAAVAAGDRSPTWRWPGTRAVDGLAIYLGTRLSARSPLLARLVGDGGAMRAIFGSASQLVPFAGLVLGVLAVRDTGGEAVPPVAALTIAMAALAVFDAGAGMVAVLTFLTGVVAHGGLRSGDDLRLLLGLGALWCIVTVLAGAARPLRRSGIDGASETWDRVADFVIAALIGGWAAQNIVLALPGLAGRQLPIADHANAAAYCVIGALLARLCVETIAAHLYPLRLDAASPAELDDPGALQRLGATALRTAAFLFFAYIVVGSSWQLWVGAALFVVPQLLAIYEDRFPNSRALQRVLPQGLVGLVLMLLVGTVVGALLIHVMDEHAHSFLADCFVLLSLPGFVLSLLRLFGRDGAEPAIGWGKRIGGVGLLALGVLLALGLVL